MIELQDRLLNNNIEVNRYSPDKLELLRMKGEFKKVAHETMMIKAKYEPNINDEEVTMINKDISKIMDFNSKRNLKWMKQKQLIIKDIKPLIFK